MAAFFADVAQVIAAIFWFLIVIVKPVSLFFNRQNAWFKASQNTRLGECLSWQFLFVFHA